MPLLQLRTNRSLSPQKAEKFLRQASQEVAQALGKSENYVMTTLESDTPMTFAGNSEPCAYLELKSLGLHADQTAPLSQRLCTLVQQELGIPSERIYIEFAAPERAFWGWNGKTFQT